MQWESKSVGLVCLRRPNTKLFAWTGLKVSLARTKFQCTKDRNDPSASHDNLTNFHFIDTCKIQEALTGLEPMTSAVHV